MGSKHRQDRNFNPGPGQYEQANNDIGNKQTVNIRIGNEKVRNDIFGAEKAASNPGPGTYQSPERKSKGFIMGGKVEQKISDTPGPGNYDSRAEMTQNREHMVVMSQAKREDLWKEQTNRSELPGPGSLDVVDHTWEEGGFKFGTDDRFPKQRLDGPGPGQYELLDD